MDVYRPPCGTWAAARQDASTINHIRPGRPPFLLLCAENDLPTVPEMADEFCQALTAQGCEARSIEIKDRNHNSILFKAVHSDDPVVHLVLDFIQVHSQQRKGPAPQAQAPAMPPAK